MDSSNWSEERKQNAANKFANRTQRLLKNPVYRANTRRIHVGVNLAIAVAESQLTRQAVADKAGVKLSQLSRQLSGDVNLTLDSISKICEAIGYEFDMVLRKACEKEARQPWQQPINRNTAFKLVYMDVHKQAPSNYKLPANPPANDTRYVYDYECNNEERELAYG